ncbi:MAG: tetratricopeptide repeat protein, partial [Anaerolineales bacterium]|nr:tetratricopeptide repeat protein [Anaerolineales bacterium]
MAKVSLRIYTREIESLIEKGRTDEAIAHCRHILETFPKHLETYRLLGKAYLESRRYKEAVDILGRVLMCVPDDFVAHVSLSIIRDEEDKLDDAIWHMERASEVQPSNAAIQGELRRLYGRRDGMEPPKIRMTRGALAHMYVQGELYPQAISEIRAVLAKDPQRTDMQILLATSFLKSGQASAASDLCNQLLKDFPYCYDANRIMVDLLPAIGGVSENTQVYRMRVGELDPYAAFVKGSVFQSNEVPDAAVNLERLEYSGDEFSAGQEWSSSLGIGFDSSAAPALEAASSDDQPDWLKFGGFTDETPQFESAPAASLQGVSSPPQRAFSSEAKDDIPDFLRDVGWGEANTLERPSSIFDEDSSEKLVPADLPDWLKGKAPVSDHLDPISETRPDAVQPVETPKWATSELRKIQPELSDTSQDQPPSPSPDWLSGLDGAKASDDSAQPVALSGESDGIENTQASAKSADIPDWLRDIESKNEFSPSNDTLDALAHEQDDAVAWLESLAAKQGAKPKELVTDPGQGNENPSEWEAPAQNIDRQTPVKQPFAQEQDDAV